MRDGAPAECKRRAGSASQICTFPGGRLHSSRHPILFWKGLFFSSLLRSSLPLSLSHSPRLFRRLSAPIRCCLPFDRRYDYIWDAMGEVRRGSNLFPFPNRQDRTFRCYSWEERRGGGGGGEGKQQSQSPGSREDGHAGCSGQAGRLGDTSPVLECPHSWKSTWFTTGGWRSRPRQAAGEHAGLRGGGVRSWKGSKGLTACTYGLNAF